MGLRYSRTRFFALVTILVVALASGPLDFGLGAEVGEAPGRAAPPQATPAENTESHQRTAVQGGPAPALVIFFTGEVMGWTEPCG